MKKYRIIKKNNRYYIQYKHKFLLWDKWSYERIDHNNWPNTVNFYLCLIPFTFFIIPLIVLASMWDVGIFSQSFFVYLIIIYHQNMINVL